MITRSGWANVSSGIRGNEEFGEGSELDSRPGRGQTVDGSWRHRRLHRHDAARLQERLDLAVPRRPDLAEIEPAIRVAGSRHTHEHDVAFAEPFWRADPEVAVVAAHSDAGFGECTRDRSADHPEPDYSDWIDHDCCPFPIEGLKGAYRHGADWIAVTGERRCCRGRSPYALRASKTSAEPP